MKQSYRSYRYIVIAVKKRWERYNDKNDTRIEGIALAIAPLYGPVSDVPDVPDVADVDVWKSFTF